MPAVIVPGRLAAPLSARACRGAVALPSSFIPEQLLVEKRLHPASPQLPGIEYIGEIDERAKGKFLGDALALLFPIDWPEPFGLVMIEAMACGTPVLAFRHGSVPEVIDEGITGYVVDSVDEAFLKMGSLHALDRGRVRRRFEERFSVARMASDYVRIY